MNLQSVELDRTTSTFFQHLHTYLFVEAHIVNTDGSDLDADTDVIPVNLWIHSLFSDVTVSLSEKLVSPPTSMGLHRYSSQLLTTG